MEKDLANALDLSESEEEEEMEDLIEDFAIDMEDEVTILLTIDLVLILDVHLGFSDSSRKALFLSISPAVPYVFSPQGG